jgi:hypothetical protein
LKIVERFDPIASFNLREGGCHWGKSTKTTASGKYKDITAKMTRYKCPWKSMVRGGAYSGKWHDVVYVEKHGKGEGVFQ